MCNTTRKQDAHAALASECTGQKPMRTFMTPYWRRAKERSEDIPPAFARHLRDLARSEQIAYVRLMREFDGNPVGVECRHKEREAWAFVLPNVSSEEAWRVQYLDIDGFSRHACFNTLLEAVQTMVSEGYATVDKGALDHLSVTDRWNKGVRRSAIHQKACSGDISWEEAFRQMAAVT